MKNTRARARCIDIWRYIQPRARAHDQYARAGRILPDERVHLGSVRSLLLRGLLVLIHEPVLIVLVDVHAPEPRPQRVLRHDDQRAARGADGGRSAPSLSLSRGFWVSRVSAHSRALCQMSRQVCGQVQPRLPLTLPLSY